MDLSIVNNVGLLITKMKKLGISAKVVDNQLKLNLPADLQSNAIIEEIRSNKQGLIDHLNKKANNKSFKEIGQAEQREHFVLSSAQKRLYFLQQLNQDSTTYNMPQIESFEEMLDVRQVEEAFRKLILRHSSLRTSFKSIEGEVRQFIQDSFDFKLEQCEVTFEEAQEKISGFVKPFDLSQGPLLRASLMTISNPGQYGVKQVLIVDMHHIITDGISNNVLIQDLIALYQGQILPPLKLQYHDYAEWQQRAHQGAEKVEHFWAEQFQGEIPVLELPTDYPRSNALNDGGDYFRFDIGAEELKSLQDISKANGATLYMTLLTICNIWFMKLTGQEDIVIGCPVAGRLHDDLESVIGMFVNTLALRNYPSGDKSFGAFLSEVKQNTLNAFDHQEYQLEDLVETLNVKRDFSRNPLFDVLFTFDRGAVRSATDENSNQSPLISVKSKFDVTVDAIASDSGIHFEIKYRTQLFKKETIARFATYFKKIVSAVCQSTQTTIAALDVLSDTEKQDLLFKFNDTKTDYPEHKSVLQLFFEQKVSNPDHVAVVFEENEITYRELWDKAGVVTNQLQGLNKSSNIAAVYTEPSLELAIAVIGIMRAGMTFLPLDPDQNNARQEEILVESNCDVLVTQKHLESQLTFRGAKVVVNNENKVDPAIDQNMPSDYNHNVYIIYTSGSTGKPKGVMIAQNNLTNYVCWLQKKLGLGENDKSILTSSFAYDLGYSSIFPVLCSGGQLHLVGKSLYTSPADLVNYIAESGISYLKLTPSLFSAIVRYTDFQKSAPKQLKHVLLGGEAINTNDVQAVVNNNPGLTFINHYGPTETTIGAIAKVIDNDQIEDFVSTPAIGNPIDNTQCYVLDNHGGLVPIGSTGELYIGGEGVGLGYSNNELQNERSFITNPFIEGEKLYKTGDLVKRLPNGEIAFLGRIDNQVKIRGFRVELGEIERKLSSYKDVQEATVQLIKHNSDQYIVGYYVAERELESTDLRNHLSSNLPDYMIPTYFISLGKLPLTANGKLDKKALPTPELVVGDDFEKPVTQTEHTLVAIWSEVLQLEEGVIGVTKSFFELGGHSLNAMMVVNKVAQILNVDVPLRDIFKYQDIRSLATHVTSIDKNEYQSLTKADEKDSYELSSAQKRLYILSQLDPYSIVYNVPQLVCLEGKIEKRRLEQAFDQLVARHESLRTLFEMIDYAPRQKVLDQTNFKVQYFESSEEDVPQVIGSFIQPFDLSKAPLFRVGLVQDHGCANEPIIEKAILMVDMHHIITDGVSKNILIKDFMTLYNGEELPALQLHYKDYAEWQQSDHQQSLIDKQKAFWLNEFKEEVSVLELPTDIQRTAVRNYEGKSLAFGLTKAETDSLQKLANASGSTLYMLLLSLYNVLLCKLTNQEDIVIGTPVAGRRHADLEGMIGMFVNTMPLRNHASGQWAFNDFLKSLTAKTLACFENQDYQYEQLIDELNVARDTSRNPLFDVMFSYQNYKETDLKISDISISPYNSGLEVSKFDLTLNATMKADQLFLNFQYSIDLFKQSTIERFINYFQQIVASVTANSSIKLGDINIVDAEESHLLLSTFNDTKVDFGAESTVLELFDRQALNTPDHVALKFGSETLSYIEVQERVDQIAGYLQGVLKVQPGDIIGVMLERDMDLIPMIFGVMKAGGVYLPIDPDYPVSRINALLDDATPQVLITRGKYLDSAINCSEHILDIDQSMDAILSYKGTVTNEVTGSSLAYIIYTSGSTGKPKGVMIEHYTLHNIIMSMQSRYPLESADCYLLKTASSFDVSMSEIFGWFHEGGSLSILPAGWQADAQGIVEVIQRDQITHMNFVPSMFAVFLTYLEQHGTDKINSLKYIFLAGEALPHELVTRFNQLSTAITLENIYGPTEATIYSCGYSTADLSSSLVPIGKPLDNVSFYIVGSSMSLQPVGVPGELCIGGPVLARGYLNQEELTNEKFIANPFVEGDRLYKTGDLARWLPDGNIEFLGRIDNQVKIRGFRVEIAEIELQLSALNTINEVIVVADETNGDKYLIAYYVADEPIEIQEIRTFLSKTLPDYMIPSYFVHLEKMPLNTNGKIDRKSLPKWEMNLEEDFQAPVTEVEKQLTGIWSEVLKIESDKISILSNFFTIGGHSLKAAVLVNRMNKEFGIELPLRMFFRVPTIKELALFIEGLVTESEDSTVEEDMEEFSY